MILISNVCTLLPVDNICNSQVAGSTTPSAPAAAFGICNTSGNKGLSVYPYITIERWNIPQPRPGYEGLRQEFSYLKKIAEPRSAIAIMPKNPKPLPERGAGASIGEIYKSGNHEGAEFNVPYMREDDSRYLPTISSFDTSVNNPKKFSNLKVGDGNLEAQGEVA